MYYFVCVEKFLYEFYRRQNIAHELQNIINSVLQQYYVQQLENNNNMIIFIVIGFGITVTVKNTQSNISKQLPRKINNVDRECCSVYRRNRKWQKRMQAQHIVFVKNFIQQM